MPANFTEKEREEIRQNLINAGYRMSRESGLKGMTVAKLAESCRIAKGTFYHFLPPRKSLFLHCLRNQTGRRCRNLRH